MQTVLRRDEIAHEGGAKQGFGPVALDGVDVKLIRPLAEGDLT